MLLDRLRAFSLEKQILVFWSVCEGRNLLFRTIFQLRVKEAMWKRWSIFESSLEHFILFKFVLWCFRGCRANKGTRKQEREEKTIPRKQDQRKEGQPDSHHAAPIFFACLAAGGWDEISKGIDVKCFFPCILAGCIYLHNSLLWCTPYLQQRHIGKTYRNKNGTMKRRPVPKSCPICLSGC